MERANPNRLPNPARLQGPPQATAEATTLRLTDRPAPPPAIASIDLYSAVLSGRTANTLRSYASAYRDFAAFIRIDPPAAALDTLFSFSHGNANAAVLSYRAHLLKRQLAPSTINTRLAALRSACKLCRQLGKITWSLEVESPRSVTYRDTRGPGDDGWKAMHARAKELATTPAGRRNFAIVRLLHDLGLRRGEVVALDLVDVELDRSRLAILGKGKTQRTYLTIPRPTRIALEAWLADRGKIPGPVFHRLDNAAPGASPGRLTGESVRQLVATLGRGASLPRPVRPHGLRHQAITQVLDMTGGNVREARKFSRHAKLETLLVYDDARSDVAGELASRLAEED